MKKSLLIPAALCTIFFVEACKKERNKTTSCTTTALYGYVSAATLSTTASPFFAHIDAATMATSTFDSIANNSYANQATFNTSDNCYYVFKSGWGWSTDKLLKITTGGTETVFTNSAGAQFTEGLVYNPINNKLYCLLGGSPASVAEVTISGSTYTATSVATATGTALSASPASSTVNPGTGDMYFSMRKASTEQYSVEQYHPGAATTTVINSGTGAYFMGLRFNLNDNMLYGIKETGTGDGFVKMTTGGAVTSLATIPSGVNNEFYSATLDHCSNRYIVSTVVGSSFSSGIVEQLNMSGTIVQTDTTAGVYQGLDILY